MASAPTFEDFEAAARAEGYGEFLVREWEAGRNTGEHTHPFDASLRVVRGALEMLIGGTSRRLAVGDTCKVPRNVVHAEIYGPEGATLWVARAN
ncbi:MAG: cupin domain-containing protein [Rhodospirillales bacterium]|nr:cupin domain-containing protein [Rhodospirillales bacterium]